jgi:NTE family protein
MSASCCARADGQPVTRGDRAVIAPATTAFVLGGGGVLGAYEVGMVEALLERGISPDLIVGTSIGALNGLVVAAGPNAKAGQRLRDTWRRIDSSLSHPRSVPDRLRTLVQTRSHLLPAEPLRSIIADAAAVDAIEDLPVRYECVAASIEDCRAQYFGSGAIVDAVLASCSVPGLMPPARIGDRHYLDGGLVSSIPLDRALHLGAQTVYVLHVGRIEQPLTTPTNPLQLARVAFEIARRGRFNETVANLDGRAEVHVLPTRLPDRASEPRTTAERIDSARNATRGYLDRMLSDNPVEP